MSWIFVTGAGGGSGVSTVGTYDSQTVAANGLVISGTSIYAQSADATHPGMISTGTQTLAGNKTLNGVLVTQDTQTFANVVIADDAITVKTDTTLSATNTSGSSLIRASFYEANLHLGTSQNFAGAVQGISSNAVLRDGTGTFSGSLHGNSSTASNVGVNTVANAIVYTGLVRNVDNGTITQAIGVNVGVDCGSGAITTGFGVKVAASLGTPTTNYGVYTAIASGSNQFNFYAAGTAANYFAGVTSVGSSSQFSVNATGNITKINNITTSFPAGQGSAGARFENDGSGNLSWKTTAQAVVSTLTDGATPALDASLGTIFILVAAGNRTIAVPSNAVSGQKIVIRHNASGGARTLALNSGAGGFRFGSDITSLSATASGKTDYIGCIYNATDSFWDVVGVTKGF